MSIQGQGPTLTVVQGHLYIKIKTCLNFSQNHLAIFYQILYASK